MSHGTSSVGRCRHRRAAAFIPCRLVALRPAILSALIRLFLAAPANAQFARKIFEVTHPYGGGPVTGYMDTYNSQYDYVFGRSEGTPPVGPNPLNGSSDVDQAYDMVPVWNQYYVDKFNRNGPNGLGGTGNGTTNAFTDWRVFANANFMTDGSPNQYAYAGGSSVVFSTGTIHDLDLAGHEIYHIATRFFRQNADSSFVRLAATGEAGSLGEGLADFFGEAMERYVSGNHDWLFKIGVANDLLRDLANPANTIDAVSGLPHPDRYLSPNFYTGTGDSGGIHINSTVLSHGAYLAVEGGSFNGYTIDGIGFDKLEQILYRATTQYFDANETFNQAYDDIIHAAGDLYDPADVAELTKALQAVEMNLSLVMEPGDANNDGFVDGGDYTIWADHYLQTDQGWGHGDFTGDRITDGGDYTIWADNYAPEAAMASAVPEPSTLALAGIGALALLACGGRRRFCN